MKCCDEGVRTISVLYWRWNLKAHRQCLPVEPTQQQPSPMPAWNCLNISYDYYCYVLDVGPGLGDEDPCYCVQYRPVEVPCIGPCPSPEPAECPAS